MKQARAIVLKLDTFASSRDQLGHPEPGIIAKRQQRRIAQARRIAATGIEQRGESQAFGWLAADLGAEPQGARLALRHALSLAHAAQGIAHQRCRSRRWQIEDTVSLLRLGPIVEEKPVKTTVELTGKLARDLADYAAAHAKENGLSEALPIERLIPPMLERFIATDRGFAKARR